MRSTHINREVLMRFRSIMLVFTLATLLSGAPARAQHTMETFTDFYGMCLEGAVDEYQDCKSEGGFLWDVGCGLAYFIDFAFCAIFAPVLYLQQPIK